MTPWLLASSFGSDLSFLVGGGLHISGVVNWLGL
jgi:hypothetical protein